MSLSIYIGADGKETGRNGYPAPIFHYPHEYMEAKELASKLATRVEFMILQHLPKPTCATKHAAHAELVKEVKRLLADKLNPPNHGLTINITP